MRNRLFAAVGLLAVLAAPIVLLSRTEDNRSGRPAAFEGYRVWLTKNTISISQGAEMAAYGDGQPWRIGAYFVVASHYLSSLGYTNCQISEGRAHGTAGADFNYVCSATQNAQR